MPADSETEDFLKHPLADIINEVKRLRAQNAPLTASNNDLQRKVATQRLILGLYASQLGETKRLLQNVVRLCSSKPSKTLADAQEKVHRCGLQLPLLPPEILLAIFRFTQPPGPPYHHPPSLYRGPRNPWLDSFRTKKALILVCKAWSAPATELLYYDIVLRRMGQISALANTFRRDRKQSLANLVRAIRVDVCVVLTHCAKIVREDFEYILAHCRMLHTYVFIPHPQFSFQPYDFACGAVPVPTNPTAFNPTWIFDLRQGRAGSLLAHSMNSRLVTLHLDLTTYKGSFSPLAHLLSSAPCLTSLELGSLSPRSDNPPSAPSQPLPDLSFPVLKMLSIYCDFPPFVHYVTAQWTMPRLASLTCMASDHVSIPISLLDAHGKYLEYLHFMHTGEPHNLLANTVLLPRLHELCPRIIHLVLPIVPEERPALNIHSPTLLYLDICARPSVAAYRAVALAPTAHAPQLKKVRMVLDVCAFVPRYFHPAHMPGADRALEDVEHIPGMETSDAQANWLLSTSGGIAAEFSEWRIRQHSWAVTLDPTGVGIAAGAFPPAAGEDPDEIDSSGEYEYASLPPSPVDSDTSGDEAKDDKRPGGHSDAGSDADSDLERAWITVRAAAPPVPARIVFVDDLLDSTGRQYDRETVLERLSRSQLGDFLLD